MRDKMGKIADVVKLKAGYANFVNMKSAYDAVKENADRMAKIRQPLVALADFSR